MNTPTALGPTLKEEYPEILECVRFANGFQSYAFSYGDKRFNEYVRIADPAVLEIFTFPLVKGDPATALSNPHSVVMTEEMAAKYFGDEEPIGKILRVNSRYDFIVTGVMQKLPTNSSLHFDFLFPMKFLKEDWRVDLNTWTNFAWATYILVEKNSNMKDLNVKIADRINRESGENNVAVFLSPYNKLRLFYLGYGRGTFSTVIIFIMIALLILLIASINFMNLTTARASSRAKEIGMRKIAGAYKKDIMKQFYGESILFSAFSLFFALLLVRLLLPLFNNLTAKQLTLDFSGNPVFLFVIIGVTLFTGIVSGSYPALFMSSFNPIKILKGTIISGPKSSRYRKGLVVIQFTVSIIFILMTMTVYKQLDYVRQRNPGFNREHLLYFRINRALRQNFETAKLEILQNPGILSVSGVSSPMITIYDSADDYNWEGKNPVVNPDVRRLSTDFDFLTTMGVEMAQGAFFSRELTKGSSDISGQIVINETFADMIGIENPVGARLTSSSIQYTIIGVVKDFNYMSLYREIGPLALYHKIENSAHGSNRFRFMFIRVRPDFSSETITHIGKIFEKFNPESAFEYRFLDADFDLLYRSEQQAGLVLRYSALLTIVISCLGLFGLASFVAEQRTKEIGIRKVLGSSIQGIILLLSKDFLKRVIVANLIAWPTAFFVSRIYLQRFAYRVSIGWTVFILVGLFTLGIALITVSFQAVKAARANPVKSLKYE